MGSTIGSTSSAGYEASGRDFRYISSTITVPDTSFLTGIYPQEYIQLSNGSLTQPTGGGDQYTRAGIEPCVVAQSFGDTCTTGTWVAFVEAFNNSLTGPYFSHFYNLAGVNQGDGVNFSIYYYQGGNELHFVITPPLTSGTPQFYKTRAYGPIYDHAAALDDFTDSTGTPIPLPFFLHSFRINQFLQGALTTYSGAKGSFVGPWTTSKVVATSNGLVPPSGTHPGLAVQPLVGRPVRQRGGAGERRLRRLGSLVTASSGRWPGLGRPGPPVCPPAPAPGRP